MAECNRGGRGWGKEAEWDVEVCSRTIDVPDPALSITGIVQAKGTLTTSSISDTW